MKNETIKYLIQLAETEAPSDDDEFNACDYSGGNLDDACSLGYDNGSIKTARFILDTEGIEYKRKK